MTGCVGGWGSLTRVSVEGGEYSGSGGFQIPANHSIASPVLIKHATSFCKTLDIKRHGGGGGVVWC